MTPIFEAKYIDIEWYDRDTVLKISQATLPTKVEIENTVIYNIELQTYTRIEGGLDGQIAFHIFDTNSSITPYFIDASNKKVTLIKIIDPSSNKAWWIEDGHWSKSNKYRSSPLWNHIGDAKIIFGDTACNINVRANSFTREQLDLYLNDFRNDFWYLILQKDSITQGDAKNTKVKLLNNDTTELISKFIEYIEKVLGNPKKELREVQRLKDIKKVKPVARTFMEIATTGFQRKMTSRDTVESYNVPENRYIHYILQRAYDVVFYMLRASGHMEDIYENKYNLDKERLENFSDKKTIDKEAYDNEILNLENRIRKEKDKLMDCISKQDDDLRIKLKKEIEEKRYEKKISISNDKFDEPLKKQPNIGNVENIPIENLIIKLDEKRKKAGNRMIFLGTIKNSHEQYTFEFNEVFGSVLREGQEYTISSHSISNMNSKYFVFIKSIEDLNVISNDFNQSDDSMGLEYKTIFIMLQYKQNEYQNKVGFWGKGKNNLHDNWFVFNDKDSYSLEFNKNTFGPILNEFSEYKISGYIRKSKFQKQNGGVIQKSFFEYITNIEMISKSTAQTALESLEPQRKSLEMTNWERPLDYQEKQEQENERRALKTSTNLLKEKQKNNLKLLESLEPKLHKLKQLLNRCNVLKIKQDSYFPNSMTFVQNPNYQGAHSFYKRINDIVGVDENLFIQLQLVEKIGLIDIPAIYERWCLLQIIKILIDKFRFSPEENWKIKLANQVIGNLNKVRDVKIKFTNASIMREVDLWYEKELPSRKRPDFVLDIRSTLNSGNTHRLVMDAKFHEEVDVENQIALLYNQKDYSEKNRNTVFILHPDANKSIKKKRTPKKWGHDAYYGEIEMFNYEWDDKNPNHKYGAILLSPITKEGNYLDNLQRLIGMSMQYNLEDNKLYKDSDKKIDIIDPIAHEKVFCFVCGSDKCEVTKETASKYPNRWQYKITCTDCNHYFEYNYCWACKYRLVKNGRYWSYHSAQILDPFDIKCPHCGRFWTEKKVNN